MGGKGMMTTRRRSTTATGGGGGSRGKGWERRTPPCAWGDDAGDDSGGDDGGNDVTMTRKPPVPKQVR